MDRQISRTRKVVLKPASHAQQVEAVVAQVNPLASAVTKRSSQQNSLCDSLIGATSGKPLTRKVILQKKSQVCSQVNVCAVTSNEVQQPHEQAGGGGKSSYSQGADEDSQLVAPARPSRMRQHEIGGGRVGSISVNWLHALVTPSIKNADASSAPSDTDGPQ